MGYHTYSPQAHQLEAENFNDNSKGKGKILNFGEYKLTRGKARSLGRRGKVGVSPSARFNEFPQLFCRQWLLTGRDRGHGGGILKRGGRENKGG